MSAVDFAYAGQGGGASIIILVLIFFLLRPKQRTLLDTIIFWFGNASVVYVIGMAIISQIYRSRNWDNFIAVDVVIYVLLLIMASIRYLGESNHIVGFGRQAANLFSRLFLYLFLPAILLTGLSFAIAHIFFGIRF